jgi:hypothetical protein
MIAMLGSLLAPINRWTFVMGLLTAVAIAAMALWRSGNDELDLRINDRGTARRPLQ